MSSFFCRSEEHTSELQSHSEISYAVFCMKTKNNRPAETQPIAERERSARIRRDHIRVASAAISSAAAWVVSAFFCTDTATTEIYTLSYTLPYTTLFRSLDGDVVLGEVGPLGGSATVEKLATKDRKSTRLNSSHIQKSRMPSSA